MWITAIGWHTIGVRRCALPSLGPKCKTRQTEPWQLGVLYRLVRALRLAVPDELREQPRRVLHAHPALLQARQVRRSQLLRLCARQQGLAY